MKTVVVFGATGNLGANISMHLHKLGYNVIPVGHRKDDNGFFKDYGMQYHSVNIENEDDFEKNKDYIEIVEQKVERNPFENKNIKPI